MKRVVSFAPPRFAGLLVLLSVLSGIAWAEPTCETLLDALPTVFEEATAYGIGVGIMQGDNELAYELQRAELQADGTWTTTTLERRGLPRPPGTGNESPDGGFSDLGLICDAEHTLEVLPSGSARLDLAAPDPDGAVKSWSLEFQNLGNRWVPREMIGVFETRILFVPVSGSFNTTFSNWSF